MHKTLGFFGLLLTAAMFLGGCASGATAQGMTVRAADITGPASPEVARAVAVSDVDGGEKTNPLWTSQIDNPEFKKALLRSLQAAGLLASGNDAKYVVSAELVSLKQPLVAFNMTVTSRVRYTLKEAKTGKVLFAEDVSTAYTATMGDSLIGVQRLRLANEGSARKSIAVLIQRLNASGRSAAVTATHAL